MLDLYFMASKDVSVMFWICFTKCGVNMRFGTRLQACGPNLCYKRELLNCTIQFVKSLCYYPSLHVYIAYVHITVDTDRTCLIDQSGHII